MAIAWKINPGELDPGSFAWPQQNFHDINNAMASDHTRNGNARGHEWCQLCMYCMAIKLIRLGLSNDSHWCTHVQVLSCTASQTSTIPYVSAAYCILPVHTDCCCRPWEHTAWPLLPALRASYRRCCACVVLSNTEAYWLLMIYSNSLQEHGSTSSGRFLRSWMSAAACSFSLWNSQLCSKSQIRHPAW